MADIKMPPVDAVVVARHGVALDDVPVDLDERLEQPAAAVGGGVGEGDGLCPGGLGQGRAG